MPTLANFREFKYADSAENMLLYLRSDSSTRAGHLHKVT